MQDLIRGTTPSLIVDFSDTEVSVTDITQAVLVITQAGKSDGWGQEQMLQHLADCINSTGHKLT